MRVVLLSGNAPRYNAVGNQIAEKVRFFLERGAGVQLFVQDNRQLHPDLQSVCTDVDALESLSRADLIIVVYAQYFELLQFLPRLSGTGPRIIFEYLGVTPAEHWHVPQCESLKESARQRGYVWCADHALVASQASRRELLDATRFPADAVTVLPYVVDTDRFHPEPQEHFWQEYLDIGGRVLLYVGRLAGNKRVPLLIEAMARLKDPSIHAAIVGDVHDVYAEETARCQSLARDLGIAERVHFTGELGDEELARAYRSSAALVMPSLHEGFCVPVIEAMASGLPVIASRSTALPQTVGAAGLTFSPNDVDDLVRQLSRVLDDFDPPTRAVGARRIAFVSFRFGPDIVGGAETSLRTMAKSLQKAGQHVEVFTTCASTESDWQNALRVGTVTLDGLTVHRFPIDDHDAAAHAKIMQKIVAANGRVAPGVEQQYLDSSIHSTALIQALRDRAEDFDAIIAGPYLFGLTADIASTFPGKTLLMPCFHDEALARLAVWPDLYGNVGGLLYHSREEQDFAQIELGVNHPNAHEIGTCATIHESDAAPYYEVKNGRPYIVYCGRYCAEKNVPLLLEWTARYQADHPERLDIVFIGQDNTGLPREPWLHNLGRVNEATKRSVLAGARALIQLSTHESLSLVVLEAWAEATPVIVHRDCAVLAGQVERSQGGQTVSDYATFAAALNSLLQKESVWKNRGAAGREYLAKNYSCITAFANRLTSAIDRMRVPLRLQMRQRGLERASLFSRKCWQQRFTEFIEYVLTQPARARRDVFEIVPLRAECRASVGTRTLLLPIRLINAGTHPGIPDGPGRTVVCCEVRDEVTGESIVERNESSLPGILMPGHAQTLALPIALPMDVGSYRAILWMEQLGRGAVNRVDIPLIMEAERADKPGACASTFLETIQQTLPRTHELQQLPDDYVDVTEGRFAPFKRLVKGKLLNNFKRGYVDVMSRQQSQVNGQVVLMIQQLAECCAMLDHAVTGLNQRLDQLEAIVEQVMGSQDAAPEVSDLEIHG